MEFTDEATLERPIDLISISAANPSAPVDVYARDSGRFVKGSYFALHSADCAWQGLFGLAGGDALNVHMSTNGMSAKATLRLGEAGLRMKPGDRLRYRFAVGSFIEPPRGGQYCEWFARMMDGTGFNHGDAPVSGIVELTAKDGLAECEFGSTWFIQNYPVRINGLSDNGCAMMTDGDKIWRPLAFDGDAAYAAVPLEQRKRWKFLNLYDAGNPALRLTFTPAIPGHGKATLQVQNLSGEEVSTRIRNIRTGETSTARVPACGMIVLSAEDTPSVK